jgi:hypothetical protein
MNCVGIICMNKRKTAKSFRAFGELLANQEKIGKVRIRIRMNSKIGFESRKFLFSSGSRNP